MNATEALLIAFDDAVGHQFESLRDATEGLNENVAAWQPPVYANVPQDDGVGVPGSILWHLNHLEHCHPHYAAVLDARPVNEQPDTKPPGELALEEILPKLAETTGALRGRVAALTPDGLDQPCTSQMSTAQFVCMFVRHIAWHAAQIKQTRRLYANR